MITNSVRALPLQLIRQWDERVAFPIRQRHLVERLVPYIKGAHRVLDLGASDGRLASRIAAECPGVEMFGADVYIQPSTFIPVTQYDGVHLPFEDNSFDIVMLVDVLHHDENPERVIAEARRVAKNRIIIKDHYWNTRTDFRVLAIADYIGNAPYNIRLPYNYLAMSRWHEIFVSLDLKLFTTETFRFKFVDPVKQVIFVLEKSSA